MMLDLGKTPNKYNKNKYQQKEKREKFYNYRWLITA